MVASRVMLFLMFVLLFSVPRSTFAVASGKTLTWQGGGQGAVIFEGEEHAEKKSACGDCHPGLFMMKKGATKMTMAALNQGKYCGACHNGKKVFGTDDPKHCHECHKENKKQHEKHEKHEKKDHHD
jgi:c(7)-type cytochrome triheme protein